MTSKVITLDLNFLGRRQTIASYMIPHSSGVVLIESGPGSTREELKVALAEHGYTPRDVTHVLLTHIHLDHAGASGWLARQGATIYVHPVGAPHLLNPEKLLASAARIYGDKMEMLWGKFLPVPQDKLVVIQDGQTVEIGALHIVALNTPGHAEHHYSYQFEDLCFTGDVGGVRIPGFKYLRVPMPPPELHFEKWLASLQVLRRSGAKRIAPTHFGIFDDPEWHLSEVERELFSAEHWLEEVMPSDPSVDELRARFIAWAEGEGRRIGLSEDVTRAYELANPLGMSADGLQRYWRKFRAQN